MLYLTGVYHFRNVKMLKETHILKEYPDTPKGYGQMHPPTEQEERDKIFDVCNFNKYQYIKHIVSQGWVEDKDKPPHVPISNPSLSIPVGTTQYRITIYMQDK